MLRIATWNVYSLRVRLETLVPWLTQDGPDVVCLQETKVIDDLSTPYRPSPTWGIKPSLPARRRTMA